MKTPAPTTRPRPRTERSRFGYDRRFWGDPAREVVDASYWSQTRRPLAALVFVLPILIAYEVGISRFSGASAEALRTGTDVWLRQGLARVGLTDRHLPSLAIVLALLAWQAAESKGGWRLRPVYLLGMLAESVAFGVALIGLSRLVDLGFDQLEHRRFLAAGPSPPAASIVGFLGAGLYEEAIFRLALIPIFFQALRVLQTPKVLAGTLAITGSSLLFSVAHHAGAPGEPFTLFAFVFRWLAGIYFAWVFVVRGFGVAVGTHAAYDILVGAFDWHL